MAILKKRSALKCLLIIVYVILSFPVRENCLIFQS